jgi:peptide/nickel transport system ATP-binding protein
VTTPVPSPVDGVEGSREAVLQVSGLTVEVQSTRQPLVEDVSFELHPGETLGLVGESGSGKTITSLSVMGLLAAGLRITGGSIELRGEDLTRASKRRLRAVRGAEIAMIFQEPMSSLNPAFTVGNQVAEAVRAHRQVSRAEAWRRAVEVLSMVGISDADQRVRDYPHAFSGGMRQRVMIAMALACDPQVLIADEPTTAVDVTIQAQILELLRELQERLGMGILLVTHDLGVVADVCDRVVVMYAGQVVEQAPVHQLFRRPAHPYTDGLLRATPQAGRGAHRLHAIPGTVPSVGELPSGCRFHPRCGYATEACKTTEPMLEGHDREGLVRCIRQRELLLGADR